MTKSLEQLSEKLQELYRLKKTVETTGSEAEAQQVFDGAMQLLSTGKEFAPQFTRTDKDGLQQQMDWLEREIKWPAKQLRDWFLARRGDNAR